jgi:hypothetical protein
MSPYSANRSVRSSSEASSWMFVAITIQPSMLRTATAFVDVLASDPALGFCSFGEAAPFGGEALRGTESISISVDMMGEEGRSRQRMCADPDGLRRIFEWLRFQSQDAEEENSQAQLGLGVFGAL